MWYRNNATLLITLHLLGWCQPDRNGRSVLTCRRVRLCRNTLARHPRCGIQSAQCAEFDESSGHNPVGERCQAEQPEWIVNALIRQKKSGKNVIETSHDEIKTDPERSNTDQQEWIEEQQKDGNHRGQRRKNQAIEKVGIG